MNIMKLKIVILLEKYKKVTDVAAELGLKQPTVSFHMKNLENEFGTPLFLYRSGRVLLTDAGRALYQYALKIVSLTSEAERTVKQFASPSQGTLKLEASYIPATYILPKALIQFMKQYPGINNSMTIQSDSLLKERLRSREIQMAILHTPDWYDESFNFQLIVRDEPVLIFASGHPFETIEKLTPEQIALEPWIQHEVGSCLRGFADQWAELNHFRLWNRSELNSPETLKKLVCEGGGVGICSKASIEAELELGRLSYAPLPGVLPESGGFVLAWRKDHILTPLQQSFADILNNL
ncbi:LysR substrate-binding domain-containing protein [Paenibacillus sp. B-A-8]|uniref:LysR substrate-binding domain-containing protein n=1 Tax=Paenibacillus sp. B-A-8 TaxID=3400419 RepID=UPI003B02E0B6